MTEALRFERRSCGFESRLLIRKVPPMEANWF